MNPILWTAGVSVQLQVMRVAVLATTMIALMAFAYAIASSPTRVANRLGLRGLKRQRIVAQSADRMARFGRGERVALGWAPADGWIIPPAPGVQ